MSDVTLPHHGLVKAIVLADSGFQDDSRVILKEILQSFAECDEFVISLDPVRSIVDTIPAVAAHTPSEGAIFGESLQRYGKNPKCWRLLAVSASVDARAVFRDASRMELWRL